MVAPWVEGVGWEGRERERVLLFVCQEKVLAGSDCRNKNVRVCLCVCLYCVFTDTPVKGTS